MKSTFIKFLWVALLLPLCIVAQAQGRDEGKLKRAWNNMLARFNTYYNAEQILDDAIFQLEEAHKDDFTKVIPVFPEGDESNSKAIVASMDGIMAKTSKLIQGRPNSKWVDDAFLLIAKSHFYRYDMYAALEAFQYVYTQYNNREIKYDAQVWIFRTFIRQGKLYDAESILNLIQQEKNFPKRLNRMLYKSAAEMYIMEKKYKQALEMMVKAEPLLRTRTEKYRSNFILGQLYQREGEYKKSYQYFERTVKMFPPYDYAFQANLGMSRMLSQLGEGAGKNTRKYLKRMLKDDKNIDNYDEIYFELGNLELNEGKTNEAIEYYKQSAWVSQKNKIQKANSYLALANIYFTARNYSLAQAYFDSTASFITKEHPQYEQIIARQNVLSDLINSLVVIENQDSLLRLSAMSKEDLDEFIQRLVAQEKQAKEKKEKEKIQEPTSNNVNPFNQPNPGTPVTPSGSQGDWYFYNQAAISRGFTEFTRRYGNRKHTDYWRIAAKAKEYENQIINETPDKKEDEKVEEISYNSEQDKDQQEKIQSVSQDLQKYYVQIPFSDKAKIISHIKREKALFNAGKVYHENLKEFNMAIPFYEELIKSYPKSDLGAEAIFNLIKCYEGLNNPERVTYYSKLLDEKYPNSPFNKVVNHKDVKEQTGEDKRITESYNKMYAAYIVGDFQNAKKIKLETDREFSGNSLQAKFDFLYALCVARTDSLPVFLDLLRIIKESYQGTAVAASAADMIQFYENRNKPKEEAKLGGYVYEPSTPHYYILTYQGGNAEQIKKAFSEFNNKGYSKQGLQIVSSLLGNMEMLVVKSFSSKQEAEKYFVQFISNSTFFENLNLKKYDNLYISEQNFKTLLNENKADNYFDFFTRYYIEN